MAGRMDGSRCLVVGGTGGIGLATVLRFLDEGATVAFCGKTDAEVDAAVAALRAADSPADFHALTADATDPGEVDGLFREAIDLLGGRLDVLFHVAGISGRRFGDGPLHECSPEGWDAVLAANARSTFLTNRAAVRRMLSQPIDAHGLRGTVVNTGSVLSRSPAPDHFGTIAYAASKGAVEALTLAAASRYARDRVRFHMIAPALIETPMAARACSDPAIRSYLAAKQPMAGGPGAAVDVAEAALFLCEPASRFMTGVALNVDGGWSVSEGRLPPAPESDEP
ncbi:SDR family oxidoreductase [Paludisphaera sp.]|uniref:SDR family NAD(P)-dependent oxidoreductase n=1 Tax=Paludisphaera sp. TaxID=2017432 RepID=UPI00301BA26E